jgi:uncharacterized lipoprotein YddW (UPF0748 family)
VAGIKVFKFFFILGMLFCASGLFSQHASHYICYRAEIPVRIDGAADDPAWLDAEWSNDFADITGSPSLNPSLQTRVKMLWDDQYLYVIAELKEPHIWGSIRQKDAVIFQDNDFELFLDPEGDGLNYYEIEVNALGTIWDLMLTKAYQTGGKPINSWDLKGLKSAISINGTINNPDDRDSSWTVEMALPWSQLTRGSAKEFHPADGVQWRVNFSRVEWKTKINEGNYEKIKDPATGKPLPEDNWVWSPMGVVSMHLPERWGYLEFSDHSMNRRPDPAVKPQILAWMHGHRNWTVEQWDSVFALFKISGITEVMTSADTATLNHVLPLATRYGIRLQSWFFTMLNNDSSLTRQHPGWFVVNRNGKSCITDPAYVGYYRFLCPSNPDVREYLRKRVDPFLAVKGLDGIHLDYIRFPDVILPEALWQVYGIVQDKEYPQYDYCYCQVCREKFQKIYGRDILQQEHPETDSSWREFRMNQVSEVVAGLADYAHQKGKKITAAVFPGPSTAKRLVRQAWEQWPLDEVMPMLYQRFYYGSLNWIREQTREGVSAIQHNKPYFSGLYIPDLKPQDMEVAILKSLEGGATGVSLFNAEALTKQHHQKLQHFKSSH